MSGQSDFRVTSGAYHPKRKELAKPPQTPQQRMRTICAAVALVVAAVVVYVAIGYWTQSTAVAVRDGTTRALDRGDAVALCGLADPGEVKRMNITPEALTGILKETLWRGGRPNFLHALDFVPSAHPYEVEWVYEIDEAAAGGRSIHIPAVLHRDGHWYLDLSKFLLYSFEGRIPEQGMPSMREAYQAAAQKYGVTAF